METLVKQLQSIGKDKRRYKVFEDFVTMSAISLHNAGLPKESYVFKKYEQEYLDIILQYNKADQQAFSQCLAKLVTVMDKAGTPQDILGQIYMNMDFGEAQQGQFFTPDCVSQLMAQVTMGSVLENLKNKPFVTVAEPTCGAGGMLLAVVNEVIKQGYNPAQSLWIQAVDISRIAGLMCYVQLSLWNVPAQVIIGDSLRLDYREILYTPAHRIYLWDIRLRNAQAERYASDIIAEKPIVTDKAVDSCSSKKQSPPPSVPRVVPVEQLGFDF